MNEHNLNVLTNIIAGVENGGQIYGNKKYSAFSPPYHSTPKEHTITIGFYAAYGHEAQTLIQRIKDTDFVTYVRLDPDGLIDDAMLHDWESLHWNPTSKEKKIIIALIDSPAGHKAQDDIFAAKMKALVEDCKKDYPGADVYAQMMYCEIRHLGGRKPVNRIFDRCKGKYDLDTIMAALVADQKDTSNNNQVGDKIFWSRHVKCRQFIDQYAIAESEQEAVSMKYDPQKVINVAMGEVGYYEKSNSKNLDDKTAGASSGNYTKYWRDMRKDYQGSAWCDCFVGWCFVQAYGKAVAEYLQCGGTYSFYTPTSAQYYKNKKQWYSSPKVGDQAFFKNSTRICHTGIVYAVENGRVYTVEGNAGNKVQKKNYKLSDSYIAGFGRPDYGMDASGGSGGNHATVAQFQKFLNNNYAQILKTAGVGQLVVDGDYGPKTRAAALAVFKFMANKYYDADLTIGNNNFFGACHAVAARMTDEEVAKHPTLKMIQEGILEGRGYSSVDEFREKNGIHGAANTWHALFN